MTTAPASERARLLTIGAVCERLKPEFPDISISKIRYLEGEGLVTPARTRGGYRLFGEEELARLETILRLQRDEFLPLKVIREELEKPTSPERRRRRARGLRDAEDELDQATLCKRAGIDRRLARELEEYGLLAPRVDAGERLYSESDAEIAAVCGRLAGFGIAPRHLRTFRTSVDRETGLLDAAVAPALRSRNPERRQQGTRDLQTLGELAQELSQRLFWRGLRGLVS
ncbi:MAG: MerR family transcriptional regulator [Gaiellaceae bacterium]